MKKVVLFSYPVVIMLLLFSCKKENAQSHKPDQLTATEAYYKNKIAGFLTLSNLSEPDKNAAAIIHVHLKSYQEIYEYFKFLDPGQATRSSSGKAIQLLSGNNGKTAVQPSDINPTVGVSWYGYDLIYPPSTIEATYDGNVPFNAKITNSSNPGNIGITAHLRFTWQWPSSGFGSPFLAQNRVISSAVFYGGAGTMTSQSVLVTPGGQGGTMSGQVQWVITGMGSSISGYATLQGSYNIVPPVNSSVQTCLVNYTLTARGNL